MKIKYITDDGTEFDSEEACILYEECIQIITKNKEIEFKKHDLSKDGWKFIVYQLNHPYHVFWLSLEKRDGDVPITEEVKRHVKHIVNGYLESKDKYPLYFVETDSGIFNAKKMLQETINEKQKQIDFIKTQNDILIEIEEKIKTLESVEEHFNSVSE